MMALLDVRAWLAIACAVLLGLVGLQQVRVSNAKSELSALRTSYAQAALKAEQETRAKEATREQEKQDIIDSANKQAEEAIAAVSAADAASASLRQQLVKYSAAIRANTGAGKGSTPAATALDLFAGMLARTDDAAGELAKFADDSRRAGLACEASYQSLTR